MVFSWFHLNYSCQESWSENQSCSGIESVGFDWNPGSKKTCD